MQELHLCCSARQRTCSNPRRVSYRILALVSKGGTTIVRYRSVSQPATFQCISLTRFLTRSRAQAIAAARRRRLRQRATRRRLRPGRSSQALDKLVEQPRPPAARPISKIAFCKYVNSFPGRREEGFEILARKFSR